MRLLVILLTAGTPLLAQSPASDPATLERELRTLLDARSVTVVDLALPAGIPARTRVQLPGAGTLLLHRAAVRARDFTVGVQDVTGRIVEVPAPPERTYRGAITDRPATRAAMTLTSAGLRGALFDAAGATRFVQPVRDLIPGAAPTQHVWYLPSELPRGFCGVDDHAPGLGLPGGRVGMAGNLVGGLMVAEIAFDADFDYFQFVGSSTTNVIDQIEATLNVVNEMYEEYVEITHRITRIVVRTSEPDPYDGSDAGVILGTQFRGEWNTNQASVPRDMAHLITSRGMGNILGLAYVGVVCNRPWSYGLSRFRNNLSSQANVLGHELGHNWNAPHCLDTCDIMCGCGINGGFGPNDQIRIRSFRDSRDCLERLYSEAVGHWRLDEQTGTTAADATIHGTDGTYFGAPTLGATGAAGSTGTAVGFDGADDHVRILTADPRRSDVTFTTWIRPRRFGGFQRIFGLSRSWSVGLANNGLVFTVDGVSNHYPFLLLPGNQWSHLAVAIDGNDRVRFWVDGQPAATLTVRPRPSGFAVWFLGTRDGLSEFFDGWVDDPQLYVGALDDSEVAWLHANPGRALCRPSWENYGTGLAGRFGVPGIVVRGLPRIGGEFWIDIQNRRGQGTPGALIFGSRPASTPLLGGIILVDLANAVIVQQGVPISGASTLIPVPNQPNLRCRSFYFQVLQLDPAAPQQVSFTPGLRVELGG